MKRLLSILIISGLLLAPVQASQNSVVIPAGPISGLDFHTKTNQALDTLLTNNSGPSEPSEKSAYMLWADTNNALLKIRNAANDGWITIGSLGTANLGLALVSTLQAAGYTSGTATGSGGNYALAVSPAITAYSSRQVFAFTANHATPGASTLAVSGLTATDIKKYDPSGALVATVAADIPNTKIALVLYDTTAGAFVLLNPALADFSSNTATSVDGEVVLFSGTGGKTGKRATLTATILKMVNGIISAAAPGTDYQAPVTAQSAFLTADVTMTSANIFYDGPSLSLAAGTWWVTCSLALSRGTSSVQFTGKVWDGSTVYASAPLRLGAASGDESSLAVPGFPLTLAAPATIKISVAVNGTGAKIKATPSDNGTGCTNTASWIAAMKIN